MAFYNESYFLNHYQKFWFRDRDNDVRNDKAKNDFQSLKTENERLFERS